MHRTTARLHLANRLAAFAARSRHHPDKVFAKLVEPHRAVPAGVELSDEDEASLAGLERLMGFFADVDTLSGVGWLSVIDLVKARIDNLFQIRRLQAEHPAVMDEEIAAPVFVVGLPRTATTLAHKILARAQGCRGPMLWEMYHIGLERPADVEARLLRTTQKRVDQFLALSPTWSRIHPLRAEWVDEIYFLLNHSRMHNAMATMPGYREFLRAHDARPDYRIVRDTLQILQHGRGEARRWMLKHPDTLAETAAVHDVFPDATFVWTHRDPCTVMGSTCSMAESLTLLHNRPSAVDPHEIGRTWLALMPEMVDRARARRAEFPRHAIVDVAYHRFMVDPYTSVPELFERLGLPWTDADRTNLSEALDRPLDQRRHEYRMERYGLDPAMVDEAFGDYGLFVEDLTTARR